MIYHPKKISFYLNYVFYFIHSSMTKIGSSAFSGYSSLPFKICNIIKYLRLNDKSVFLDLYDEYKTINFIYDYMNDAELS